MPITPFQGTSEPGNALLRLRRKLRKRTSRSTNGQYAGGAEIMAPPYVDGGYRLTAIGILAHCVHMLNGQYSGSPRANFL